MPIQFHHESLKFRLSDRQILRNWITIIIEDHDRQASDVNFVFCSDAYLLPINKQYLKHNSLTDIITFDMGTPGNSEMEADIFISVERVKENAKTLGIPFNKELHRVMIHGVLHLLGMKDKTSEDKSAMRKAEDECLAKLEDLLNVSRETSRDSE